jgi:hypothetical protein
MQILRIRNDCFLAQLSNLGPRPSPQHLGVRQSNFLLAHYGHAGEGRGIAVPRECVRSSRIGCRSRAWKGSVSLRCVDGTIAQDQWSVLLRGATDPTSPTYKYNYYDMTQRGLHNLFEERLVIDRVWVQQHMGPVRALTRILEIWSKELGQAL